MPTPRYLNSRTKADYVLANGDTHLIGDDAYICQVRDLDVKELVGLRGHASEVGVSVVLPKDQGDYVPDRGLSILFDGEWYEIVQLGNAPCHWKMSLVRPGR